VRVDLVGRTGEPVPAGRRDVFAERQHRHVGLGGEPADAVGDERGLRRRPARRVDEQRDRREPVRRERPLQGLLHGRGVDHRAGHGPGDRGDHPVQAYERDDRPVGPLTELAGELRREPVGESEGIHWSHPRRGCPARPELRHAQGDLHALADVGVDDEAEVVAERGAHPVVDVAQPDVRADWCASARSSCRREGSMPTPSSSTMITHSLPAFSAVIVIVPPLGLLPRPVPHGVLHERLEREERQHHRQHLGRDLQLDVEPVAEAGLLQPDVALDVGELVLQVVYSPAVRNE
jgi:hypothetical protein